MRPSDIVVHAPRLNRLLRIRQAHEPALVEALVAEPAVEAFRERVLNRLARLNELERDPACVRPLIEGLSSELGAVVADNRARKAARGGQPVEDARHTLARQREVHGERGRLAGEIIDELSTRNLRPSPSASDTKSMLHRSLGTLGDGCGTRGTATRLRFRRRTCSPSSR